MLTATPIPRTLVLSYFGDMDVSELREKPAGRQKIDTVGHDPWSGLDATAVRGFPFGDRNVA